MKLCKAELPDGKPCPNEADEGQEYCPYHLADQDANLKKRILSVAGMVAGAIALGVASALTNPTEDD